MVTYFNLEVRLTLYISVQGRIQRGCTWHVSPLKLEKIRFFGVKSWFFTRNTPTIFVPPSARRNFFKCTPLTWNPGSTLAVNYFVYLWFVWLPFVVNINGWYKYTMYMYIICYMFISLYLNAISFCNLPIWYTFFKR